MLWFRYGHHEDVALELRRGFGTVSIDTWLVVVPQMMARLNMDRPAIIQPLLELLIKIGRKHPQALMYPLLVRAPRRVSSRAVC
jgi:serine/threonine-protein kinase mTOR